jgi:demethylmenaquinone methyltransferase/2-methoxy-6-polyprenyl-1,4-benzoquinol methylase
MNYYDSIAEGYDNLHGEEQARKFKLVLENIEIPPDKRVLDVGCGTGLAFNHIDSHITGIDPSIELLKIAKNRLFQVTMGSAEHLPFKANSFDIVIAMTSVHNFSDFRLGLSEIVRVCKFSAVITILKKSKNFNDINTAIFENSHDWEIISVDEDEHDHVMILIRK